MGDLTKQQMHPRAVRRETNKLRALQLRIGGRSYSQIADAMGYKSPQSAWDLVAEAMADNDAQLKETREQARGIQLARLDAQIKALWKNRADPRVSDSLTRIDKRIADLRGLDAPKQFTGAGDAPLFPIGGGYDLSKLTTAQLKELEAIALAASGPAVAPETANSSPTPEQKSTP